MMGQGLQESSTPEGGPPPSGSLRILLVEDNPINQLVASKILEKNGHRVVIACDGRQALDILEGATFDLVLMDLQMPVMDGFEATAAIRLRDQDGQHTPVIAVTANTLSNDRKKCLDAGFDDFVPKPIRWPMLKAAIDQWAIRPPDPKASGSPLKGPGLAS